MDGADQVGELIDQPTITSFPRPPLLTVDGAKIAILIIGLIGLLMLVLLAVNTFGGGVVGRPPW